VFSATGISKGLADSVVISKVKYSTRYEEDNIIACDEDDDAAAAKEDAAGGQQADEG
jgi:hypothetical protein